MPPKQRSSIVSTSSSDKPRDSRRTSTTGDRKVSITGDRRRSSLGVKDSGRGGAAPARSRSPIMWGCVADTYVYAGPLGEPIGAVAAGTVVTENQRYQDPYSNWWVSTRSTDGRPMWLSIADASTPLKELAEGKARTIMWNRVFDTRSSLADVQTVQRDDHAAIKFVPYLFKDERENSGVSVKELIKTEDGDVPSPVDLFEYYWCHVATNTKESMAKNWNLRYQVAIEDLLFSKGVSNTKADLALQALKAEFEGVAQDLVAKVIAELVKPLSQRRVVSHPTYTNYFYEKEGMLLQLCIDTSSGVYGGDRNAQKVASRTFQCQQLLSSEGPKHLLYVPLMTRIKFGGHVFLATAIPPVNRKGCVYAAPIGDAASIDIPNVVTQALRELTEALNLKPHDVVVSEKPEKKWRTALPLDAEVYVGRDRRMYLVNMGRLLPTALPLLVEPVKKQRGSLSSSLTKSVNPLLSQLLVRRLRPELLLGAQEPINVDVGVDNCHSHEDIETALKLSEYLRGDGPTAVAGQIGFQFPVNSPALPTVTCTLCEAPIDNELRFLCCRSPSNCCQICPNCFTKRMYDALAKEQAEKQEQAAKDGKSESPEAKEETPEKDTQEAEARGPAEQRLPASENQPTPLADFSDAVHCGGGVRRWPLLGPSVTALMHANGVNMSHLPFVYFRLPASSRFAVKHFVEVELIARAATRLLNAKLRGCSTSLDSAKEVEKLWVPLLQRDSAQAIKLWSRELGPEIEKCFPALAEPFDTSRLPTELLIERLQSLSGVYLTEASAASFSAEPSNPFLQIHTIASQIKSCGVPHVDMEKVLAAADFPEEVDPDLTKLDMGSILEKMLLFWIGYAPKDSDEALQPFYLADVATIQ